MQRNELILQRFGAKLNFSQIVNPNTQVHFGRNPIAAVAGDYPTLIDINNAYGNDFAENWLLPHITDLVTFTGARNITFEQQRDLSVIIATEYRYLKVTELLLFFYRFKAGRYGRFYGNVDPMIVTCALRDFLKERAELIQQVERIKEEQCIDTGEEEPMTYEEWSEIKMLTAMYEMKLNKE